MTLSYSWCDNPRTLNEIMHYWHQESKKKSEAKIMLESPLTENQNNTQKEGQVSYAGYTQAYFRTAVDNGNAKWREVRHELQYKLIDPSPLPAFRNAEFFEMNAFLKRSPDNTHAMLTENLALGEVPLRELFERYELPFANKQNPPTTRSIAELALRDTKDGHAATELKRVDISTPIEVSENFSDEEGRGSIATYNGKLILKHSAHGYSQTLLSHSHTDVLRSLGSEYITIGAHDRTAVIAAGQETQRAIRNNIEHTLLHGALLLAKTLQNAGAAVFINNDPPDSWLGPLREYREKIVSCKPVQAR